MPAPGTDKNKRLDRHSGTGTRGAPKKEGAGGKGTWGKIGSEIDAAPVSPMDNPKALKQYLAEHKLEARLHRILNDVAEKRPRFPFAYIAKNLELAVPIEGPLEKGNAPLADYMSTHRLEDGLDEVLNRLVKERPNNPFQFIRETLPLVEKLISSEEGLQRVDRGEPLEMEDEPEEERIEREHNQQSAMAAYSAEQEERVHEVEAGRAADEQDRQQNRLSARRASDAEQQRQMEESKPEATKEQREQIAAALATEAEGKTLADEESPAPGGGGGGGSKKKKKGKK